MARTGVEGQEEGVVAGVEKRGGRVGGWKGFCTFAALRDSHHFSYFLFFADRETEKTKGIGDGGWWKRETGKGVGGRGAMEKRRERERGGGEGGE